MVPPKVFTCPFRSYTISAVANLLAHNNISQICYCGQISLQSAAVDCSFSDNLTPLGVTFILLATVLICILYIILSVWADPIYKLPNMIVKPVVVSERFISSQ